MKRFITLSTLVCMFFLSLTAQEVKLTIETTAGFLKDSISAEQRQTVTDLTLTGSMNDADFYLIRDDMPKLKILNIEHIEVDTIPDRAFYGHKSLMEVTLPANVKYLGDQSFSSYYTLHIWISGMFPGLGNDVFGGDARIDVLPENKFCRKNREDIYWDDTTIKCNCEYILSLDGKKLYYWRDRGGSLTYIPDGVEIIESRSFDNVRFGTIIFRPSVRLIKKSAFSNIDPLMIHSETELCMNLNSATPPVLEDYAFDDDQFADFFLLVPKGSIDNYKNGDPQWNRFKIVDDKSEMAIEKNVFKSISMITYDSGTSIISEEMISRIEMTTLTGITLVNREVGSKECFIPTTDVRGICLVRITLSNGSSTVLKIN